ncbi:hypothetical protein ACGFY7_41460 [Streptomyces prunicolor]|uniref:hypothetical protein n=1 Tax=Streptomyces prunicolor TaxID=67348 RepID=UPI00371A5A85
MLDLSLAEAVGEQGSVPVEPVTGSVIVTTSSDDSSGTFAAKTWLRVVPAPAPGAAVGRRVTQNGLLDPLLRV